MTVKKIGLSIWCILFICAAHAFSDDLISVGVQKISWQYFGLSVQADISEAITAGVLADVTFLIEEDYLVAARGQYRFFREDYSNAYLYGMAGINIVDGTPGTKENSFTAGKEPGTLWGFGFGFEYDLRVFSRTLPPIFVNFDVGIEGRDGFSVINANYLFVNILFGAHLKL